MAGLTRIGVQPIVASVGLGAGTQAYKVGAVTADGETLSLEVSCTNDLSVAGNVNVIHWQGNGDSYRIYKAAEGLFGLIGESDGSLFVDSNLVPDTAQTPPEA